MNEFAEEATYRLSGKVELDGQRDTIALDYMQAPSEMPMPAPCCWPAGGETSSTACS